MKHHIHSVIVSFNRLELTKQTIHSYLDTVDLPHTLIVVDNDSDDGSCEWLAYDGVDNGYEVLFLGRNMFPGYATNRGWERMPAETTLLHRSDNDFAFLPGWCKEVTNLFDKNALVGQVGMRTDPEEMHAIWNVGGNNVIRRELWEQGLRYDERPWGRAYPPGFTEDSFFSPEVEKLGYEWTRVRNPCIVSLSFEDPDDPYYQETWSIRGIKAPSRRRQPRNEQ